MELHGKLVRVKQHHMKQHSDVLPFLDEAIRIASTFPIPTIVPHKATVITVKFDRIIGVCDCVETSDADDIVYAIRKERDRHMRFVKNRTAVPVDHLTMILFNQHKYWNLVSAWFGGPATQLPYSPKMTDAENDEALRFWATHALVWGCQRVREETITETCPWPQL